MPRTLMEGGGYGALCFPTHEPGGVPGFHHVASGMVEE